MACTNVKPSKVNDQSTTMYKLIESAGVIHSHLPHNAEHSLVSSNSIIIMAMFYLYIVAGDPTLTSLDQISPTTVRVTWSPPSGRATVTGYVVHYIGGGSVGTETVPSSPTSTNITGLTSGATYTISVEATSQHLSGESEEMTIRLGELTYSSVE